MKSLLGWLLFLYLLFSVAVADLVSSGQCGNNVWWELDDEGILTISGNGEMAPYFSSNPWENEIQQVIIKNGVTSIGSYAFSGWTSLSSIIIPDSVTSIGSSAFSGCTSLNSITIPSAVSVIGSQAFNNCTGLTELIFQENEQLTSLNDCGLQTCTSLVNLTLPSHITSFAQNALPEKVSLYYSRDTNILSLFIYANSQTAKALAKYSQIMNYGHYNIFFRSPSNPDYNIYLKTDNTEICIFGYMGAGGSIRLPSEIDGIPVGEFNTNCEYIVDQTNRNWDRITHIHIPDGIKTNDWSWGGGKGEAGAFYACVNVEEIIYEGESLIHSYAFQNCGKLKRVVLPTNIEELGEYIFKDCYSLESITIPNSVTSIDDSAFRGCSSLASITLPDGITSVEKYAFYDCSAKLIVSRIDCDSAKALSKAGNNFRLQDMKYQLKYKEAEEGTTLELVNCDKDVTEITIIDGVTHIGYAAFRDCSDLIYCVMPNSVTNIEEYAFANCSCLKNITISNNTTHIGSFAFSNCSALSEIFIPDKLTYLGSYVFSGCHISIYVSSKDTIAAKTVSKSYSFRIPTLPYYLRYQGSDETELSITGCNSKISELEIPEGITNIDDNAFYKCSNLSRIILPDSLISIGDYAFYDCNSLVSIIIPEGVTSIGNYAFGYCSKLTTVTVSEGVTNIGDYAFEYCSKLTTVTIPDGVTSIGKWAFYGCNNLLAVYLPDSIEQFGSYCITTYYNSGKYYPIIYCNEFSYADSWAIDNGFKKNCIVYIDSSSIDDYLAFSLPEEKKVLVGKSDQIEYSIFPDLPSIEKEWNSSNPSVVTVNQNGRITALSSGTATISLTINNQSASTFITVGQPVSDFSLPSDIWMVARTTKPIELLDVSPLDAIHHFSYKIENTNFVEADESGLLTSKSVGDSTLIVTDTLSGISKAATIHVCYPVTSIEMLDSYTTLETELMLNAVVTTRAQSYVNQLITLSSSNPEIATIDANGTITPLQTGRVTITAVSENQGIAEDVTEKCIIYICQNILSIPYGIEIIESEAIVGNNADAIEVPDSVSSIADDAFDDDTLIICSNGSYAEEWAEDNNYAHINSR